MGDLAEFAYRRYRFVEELLISRGFDIEWDPHEPDRTAWHDDGLINVRGLWLPNADTEEDADPDPGVSFSMAESWVSERAPDAVFEEQGFWLDTYSYNGNIQLPHFEGTSYCNDRRDFDYRRHVDIPYHRHPLRVHDDVRLAETAVSAELALDGFKELLTEVVAAGDHTPPPRR